MTTATRDTRRTMVFRNDGTIGYFIGPKEVSETVYRAAEWKTKPPNYAKHEVPGMHGDYADFTNEVDAKTGLNGGRYYPQLAKFPGDKRAVFRHKNDAIKAAEKRGWTIDER